MQIPTTYKSVHTESNKNTNPEAIIYVEMNCKFKNTKRGGKEKKNNV